VAGISTVLALTAIVISWFIYGRTPLKAGQPDPLKKPLGFLFTGMENKWFVDEGYFAVIINPFKRLSQFLADVIDWRFWHDWFHETVIAGTYNWVSNIALDRYADQKRHRCLCELAWDGNTVFIGDHAQGPERIRALVRIVCTAGCCPYRRVPDPEITRRNED
jgi:hypothetical protein